jgi:hypothetical protein
MQDERMNECGLLAKQATKQVMKREKQANASLQTPWTDRRAELQTPWTWANQNVTPRACKVQMVSRAFFALSERGLRGKSRYASACP